VGGGCGMKDLAYFIGSCFEEDECESMESFILDFYFKELKNALKVRNLEDTFDILEIENSWRDMYHFAWVDFYRFLKGWSPGRWNNNSYSERLTREVIEKIKN
jgi:hypothetical protein